MRNLCCLNLMVISAGAISGTCAVAGERSDAYSVTIHVERVDSLHLEALVEKSIAHIQDARGVKIVYKEFPSTQGARLVFTSASTADYPVLLNFLKLLDEELRRYPIEIFEQNNLQAIVLVKKNFYDEKPVEGLYTQRGDVIFLDFYRMWGVVTGSGFFETQFVYAA